MRALSRTAVIVSLLGGAALAGLLLAAPGGRPPSRDASASQAHDGNHPPTLHPVAIRPVAGAPAVETDLVDRQGRRVTVASCNTCHATLTPNRDTRLGDQLQTFHQGLHVAHGTVSCLSCHNADDYDTLRLADGRPVDYANVMTLCGQCHGPQLRDYQRGLHGGMNGHWDLTRGPRTRNNCVHCHDPHAPDFPLVQPVFPPRDRFAIPPRRDPHGP